MSELEPRASITPEAARELTDRARESLNQTGLLFLDTYETGAWDALGYSSWREYAVEELQVSQPRAYQLLKHAKIMKEIEDSPFSTNVEMPTEGQARALSKIPEGQRAEVWQKVVDITDGKPTAAAIRDVVAPPRPVWGTGAVLDLGPEGIVQCPIERQHIATRRAFEGVDGCPYCNRTAGERVAFLEGVRAGKRAEVLAPRLDPFAPVVKGEPLTEAEVASIGAILERPAPAVGQLTDPVAVEAAHMKRVSDDIRSIVTTCVEWLVQPQNQEKYARGYVPLAANIRERVPITSANIEAAAKALLAFAQTWRGIHETEI